MADQQPPKRPNDTAAHLPEVLAEHAALRPETLTKLEKRAVVQTMKGDERAYTMGVVNCIITAFLVGRAPQWYWVFHVLKSVVLVGNRYVRFKKQGWELYLLDFCYFIQYYGVIMCVLVVVRVHTGYESALAPYNGTLLRVFFSFCTGPLAWSIIIFRNSLVFHDIDQTVSVFIHQSPAILMWCLRWGGGLGPKVVEASFPQYFDMCPSESDLDAVGTCLDTWEGSLWCDACSSNAYELVLLPLFWWAVAWAIPYYILNFCVMDLKKLEANGKDTLYFYLRRDKLAGEGWIKRFPERFQPLSYMLMHGIITISFGSLSLIMWRSFFFHTAFLILVVYKSVNNGASFVFEQFAFKFAGQKIAAAADRIAVVHEKVDAKARGADRGAGVGGSGP